VVGIDEDALEILVSRAGAGDSPALAELRAGLAGLLEGIDVESRLREAREAWASISTRDEASGAARVSEAAPPEGMPVRPGAGPLELALVERLILAQARLAELRRRENADGPILQDGKRSAQRRVGLAERDVAAALRTLVAVQNLLPIGI